MSEFTPGRRRTKESGGRKHVYCVRMTDEENERISATARAAGVSVPWLLVESAMDPRQSVAARRALADELLGLRTLVSRIGTNINQLARVANGSGAIPPEATAAMAAVSTAIMRLTEAAVEIRHSSKRRRP